MSWATPATLLQLLCGTPSSPCIYTFAHSTCLQGPLAGFPANSMNGPVMEATELARLVEEDARMWVLGGHGLCGWMRVEPWLLMFHGKQPNRGGWKQVGVQPAGAQCAIGAPELAALM